MKRSTRPLQSPASRKFVTLITATALLAGGLVTFGLPAQSASALAIDCSYDHGLSVFIGSGRDGYTCLGGGSRTPDRVYGSGSLPGQVPAGGASVGSACTYSSPQIPDAFYGWGNISARSVTGDYIRSNGTKWHSVWTYYSRNGKYVAARDIETSESGFVEMSFNDYTLVNSGVVLQSTFNCVIDEDWVAQTPVLVGPGRDLTADPAPPATPSTTVDTRVVMAPVPTQPSKFFLRVDVVSHRPAPATTPVAISLDLENYVIDTIITSPRDSSCPEALTFAELCYTPSMSAGESQTYTFVVTERAGRGHGEPITVSTFSEGSVKVGHVNRTGFKTNLTIARPAV